MGSSNFLLLLALCLATSVAGSRRLYCKCHYSDIFYNEISIKCGHDSTSTQTSPQQRKPSCSKEVSVYISRDYEYVPGVGFYKLFRTGRTYENALARCREDGAFLAVPNSKAEAQAIAAIIKKNKKVSEAFVGIHDLNKTGTFSSVHGDPLSSLGYSQWLPGQPSGDDYCITIGVEGLYDDQRCNSWAFPFICQRPLSTHPPEGYTYIPQMGFYKIHTTPVSYEGAKQTCLKDGGHLAVIDTEEEGEQLAKMFDLFSSIGELFVGHNDLKQEGVFITETGKPVSSLEFVNWHPGEPNNAFNGEHCGTFYYAGTINDVTCGNLYPFLCEIELAKF